jgi:hypothetical protein
VSLRDQVGLETICWESDYPHSDSTWPVSPERLMQSLSCVPDDEVDAITHQNAMRHFRFDPFAVRPREQCTVGALRAGATDVDVAPRTADGRRPAGLVMASDLTGRKGLDR